MRNLLPVHFRPEYRVLKHQIVRNDSGREYLAPMVDVTNVSVDRVDALLQTALDRLPFGPGEDARDDIERDQPFLRLDVAVNRKGDADAAEQQFGLAPAHVQHVRWLFAEPARQFGIGVPDLAIWRSHFVECSRHDPPAGTSSMGA